MDHVEEAHVGYDDGSSRRGLQGGDDKGTRVLGSACQAEFGFI